MTTVFYYLIISVATYAFVRFVLYQNEKLSYKKEVSLIKVCLIWPVIILYCYYEWMDE